MGTFHKTAPRPNQTMRSWASRTPRRRALRRAPPTQLLTVSYFFARVQRLTRPSYTLWTCDLTLWADSSGPPGNVGHIGIRIVNDRYVRYVRYISQLPPRPPPISQTPTSDAALASLAAPRHPIDTRARPRIGSGQLGQQERRERLVVVAQAAHSGREERHRADRLIGKRAKSRGAQERGRRRG